MDVSTGVLANTVTVKELRKNSKSPKALNKNMSLQGGKIMIIKIAVTFDIYGKGQLA